MAGVHIGDTNEFVLSSIVSTQQGAWRFNFSGSCGNGLTVEEIFIDAHEAAHDAFKFGVKYRLAVIESHEA